MKFIVFRTSAYFLIFSMFLYLSVSFLPILNEYLRYYFDQMTGRTYEVDDLKPILPTQTSTSSETGPLTNETLPQIAKPSNSRTLNLIPVSTDFGLVIEKLGINVPIVVDVDSSDYRAYTNALRNGVVHAKGSAYPGNPGNIFIHGHSSLGFWQLGKYATVFTNLSKLEKGDKVIAFYEGKRFDYIVSDISIVPGYDINPLLRDYDESVLTLQTCDPPGTTLNRLIITARLTK